jgi:hypothetical protein
MMKQLGINEDDLDDVVFEEEEQPPSTATRWLAIGRVYTGGDYSSYCFFQNVHSAWDLVQDVKTRSLESSALNHRLHPLAFALTRRRETVRKCAAVESLGRDFGPELDNTTKESGSPKLRFHQVVLVPVMGSGDNPAFSTWTLDQVVHASGSSPESL